jgi:hypothetical protein
MENIQCDVVWFWPLERIIRRNGGWEYYVELKKSIPRLPDLDEVSLNDFLGHYYYFEKR